MVYRPPRIGGQKSPRRVVCPVFSGQFVNKKKMSGQADRTVDEALRELSEKYGSLFNTESPARTKIPFHRSTQLV